jgi:hypothetical protein
VVTAAVNPEKAQAALNKLLEETFPEIAKEREDAVGKAMEIMEKEKNKAYKVQAADGAFKRTPFSSFQRILGQRKKKRRSS